MVKLIDIRKKQNAKKYGPSKCFNNEVVYGVPKIKTN